MSVEYVEVEDGGWWTGIAVHVAMAAVGAVAFIVLVGGVALREGSSLSLARSESARASEPAPAAVIPLTYTPPAEWPRMTIYVVSSQAEARQLEANIASVAMNSMHLQTVYVADSPEAQASLNMLQDDIGQFSTDTTSIVDLRK